MSALPRDWTIGVAGHGVYDSNGLHKRPDLCASIGHPGATYNPWHDITACLCGTRWQDGDRVTVPHTACCGGPLETADGAA